MGDVYEELVINQSTLKDIQVHHLKSYLPRSKRLNTVNLTLSFAMAKGSH